MNVQDSWHLAKQEHAPPILTDIILSLATQTHHEEINTPSKAHDIACNILEKMGEHLQQFQEGKTCSLGDNSHTAKGKIKGDMSITFWTIITTASCQDIMHLALLLIIPKTGNPTKECESRFLGRGSFKNWLKGDLICLIQEGMAISPKRKPYAIRKLHKFISVKDLSLIRKGHACAKKCLAETPHFEKCALDPTGEISFAPRALGSCHIFIRGDRNYVEWQKSFPLRLKACIQTSQLLAAMHQGGVVHNDFKMGNVLIFPEDDTLSIDLSSLWRSPHTTFFFQLSDYDWTNVFMHARKQSIFDFDSHTDFFWFNFTASKGVSYPFNDVYAFAEFMHEMSLCIEQIYNPQYKKDYAKPLQKMLEELSSEIPKLQEDYHRVNNTSLCTQELQVEYVLCALYLAIRKADQLLNQHFKKQSKRAANAAITPEHIKTVLSQAQSWLPKMQMVHEIILAAQTPPLEVTYPLPRQLEEMLATLKETEQRLDSLETTDTVLSDPSSSFPLQQIPQSSEHLLMEESSLSYLATELLSLATQTQHTGIDDTSKARIVAQNVIRAVQGHLQLFAEGKTCSPGHQVHSVREPTSPSTFFPFWTIIKTASAQHITTIALLIIMPKTRNATVENARFQEDPFKTWSSGNLFPLNREGTAITAPKQPYVVGRLHKTLKYRDAQYVRKKHELVRQQLKDIPGISLEEHILVPKREIWIAPRPLGYCNMLDMIGLDYTNWQKSFPLRLKALEQISQTLSAIHQKGVVHGDVRRPNVFIFPEDPHERVNASSLWMTNSTAFYFQLSQFAFSALEMHVEGEKDRLDPTLTRNRILNFAASKGVNTYFNDIFSFALFMEKMTSYIPNMYLSNLDYTLSIEELKKISSDRFKTFQKHIHSRNHLSSTTEYQRIEHVEYVLCTLYLAIRKAERLLNAHFKKQAKGAAITPQHIVDILPQAKSWLPHMQTIHEIILAAQASLLEPTHELPHLLEEMLNTLQRVEAEF